MILRSACIQYSTVWGTAAAPRILWRYCPYSTWHDGRILSVCKCLRKKKDHRPREHQIQYLVGSRCDIARVWMVPFRWYSKWYQRKDDDLQWQWWMVNPNVVSHVPLWRILMDVLLHKRETKHYGGLEPYGLRTAYDEERWDGCVLGMYWLKRHKEK